MDLYAVRHAAQQADVASIDQYPWPGGYRPRAQAQLTWDEAGLHLTLTAWEQSIIAKETRCGGDVYKDSCMELFLQPMPDSDARYINLEVNALGVMHIGVGEGRAGRSVLSELPQGVRPQIGILAGEWWRVSLVIPTGFIAALFPGWRPHEGLRMRGNFYKCDESIHPHFGCWNRIHSAEPDFHRPECFGELVLM